MQKNPLLRVKLAGFLLALVLLPSSLCAETTPIPVGGADANAPVRLEVIMVGMATPPKLEKPRSGEESPLNPPPEVPNDAVDKVLDRAVKMNADFSAKWPKCHFRIASITAPETTTAANSIEIGLSRLISLRVTFLGDNGCLSSAK